MLQVKQIFIALTIVFALNSCGDSKQNTPPTEAKAPAEELNLNDGLVQKGLPARLDYLIKNLDLSDKMIQTLSSDLTIFNDDLLNDSKNYKLYTRSRATATNLGIYGADLNYLIHFEQSQRSVLYLVASKKLAEEIGVAMAFDQETMEQYQTNVENKDELIKIIFLAYDNVKTMLKSEDQFLMSTLVITGSWIENMYITTTLLSQVKTLETKTELVSNLVGQKEYLENMIVLIKELHEGDNIFVNELLVDLGKIKTIYDGFGEKFLSEEDVAKLQVELNIIREKIIKVE